MCLLAKFANAYFFTLTLADQHNAVADLRFDTFSHIDDRLIHGDATKYGARLSVDEDMATVTKLSWHAVAVACGENGDTRVAHELVGAGITDVSASGQVFDEADSSVKAEDGLDSYTPED